MNRPSDEPFFQFIGVSFGYPSDDGNPLQVLKDVNIKIGKGELVSIIGRNGSGKTTLSRLLAGLLAVTKGELLIKGKKIEELKKRGELPRTVGYLFSDPENQIIYPVVEEDVTFGPKNLGFPPDRVKRNVDEAIRMVGLEGYQDRAVAFLPCGIMKKVALAGILAMDTEAIILDDPFLMLDPKGILEMVDIIKRLRDKGITVVSTMSSLDEAAFSDRVFILKEGEIIFEGKFKETLSVKDIIEKAGLDLPRITQLVYRLREGGVSIPLDIISIEDMSEFLLNNKSKIPNQ